MTSNELKKEILNKIKKAKTVYIYQNFLECHFKTSKGEILWHFKNWYNKSKGADNEPYLNNWLNDFNNSCRLDENNQLFFG